MDNRRERSDKLEESVRQVVEVIVGAAKPQRVVLFGSSARGDAGPDSDLDILVVVPSGRHRRNTAREIYRRLARLGFAVDVVVVTSEDVERHRDDPSMVIATALSEGRVLYAA